MQSNQIAPIPMEATMGKLLAGSFLYEDFQITELQKSMSLVREVVNEDELKTLIEAAPKQLKVIVFACVDMAIFGRLTSETTKLLGELDLPLRMTTEVFYLRMTGQDLGASNGNDRWHPKLWKLKEMCKKYILLSPSKVTREELATVVKAILLQFIETIREFILKNI